jgi:hypothetical protein
MVPIAVVILAAIWVLNLVISISNGRNVGRAWVESKHAGGGRRFMAWCGAIMTALGYTWCIMIVLAVLAVVFHWLNPVGLDLYLNASYLLLIGPLLFTGYAITINSWANAYRATVEREGRAGAYGAAAYNSFASAYNTYNAVTSVGDAAGKALGDIKSLLRSKDAAQLVFVLGLLVVAFGGGTLIAYWQINKYAAADEPLEGVSVA